MKESRLYNFVMLVGIAILFAGLIFHSWKAVAFGALIAGAGGLFSAFSISKQR